MNLRRQTRQNPATFWIRKGTYRTKLMRRLQQLRRARYPTQPRKKKRPIFRSGASANAVTHPGSLAATSQSSRAFVPGGQIMLLLGCELVDLETHRIKLELCDLLIQVFGNRVNLILQLLRVLDHVFGG